MPKIQKENEPPKIVNSRLQKLSPLLLLGSVDGHPLPFKQLKGEEAVKEIDLSYMGLGVASAIIIASLLKENTATESFKCAISPEPKYCQKPWTKSNPNCMAALLATKSEGTMIKITSMPSWPLLRAQLLSPRCWR